MTEKMANVITPVKSCLAVKSCVLCPTTELFGNRLININGKKAGNDNFIGQVTDLLDIDINYAASCQIYTCDKCYRRINTFSEYKKSAVMHFKEHVQSIRHKRQAIGTPGSVTKVRKKRKTVAEQILASFHTHNAMVSDKGSKTPSRRKLALLDENQKTEVSEQCPNNVDDEAVQEEVTDVLCETIVNNRGLCEPHQ